MRLTLILSLTLLAACGANGPPLAPSEAVEQSQTGLTGTMKVGVVGT